MPKNKSLLLGDALSCIDNKDADMFHAADIMEDYIFKISPDLLIALLKDHTMSKEDCQCNIFWATSDYETIGAGYEYASQITLELITGEHGHIIMPRVLKNRDDQRSRSRGMAEVFTPSWVCNAQNNLIDSAWFGRNDVFNHENDDHTWVPTSGNIVFPEGKTWHDYVRDTRLEITCGEAPYIVSRYDTTTGSPIHLENRIGLLDRKLRVISENTETSGDWLKWAQIAFQNIYGYEWQGDNLLIARENLLITFIEYYNYKFGHDPLLKSLLYIAYIISWNLWQMDGLKGVIPDSCGSRISSQLSFFGEPEICSCKGCLSGDMRQHNGIYCIIRDWGAKAPKDKIRFVDFIK